MSHTAQMSLSINCPHLQVPKLNHVINNVSRLDAEEGMKARPRVPCPQPAGAGRCSKSSHPKGPSWRGSFPLPGFPLQKSSGWSPRFLSSGMAFHILLLYVRGISNTSVLCARARNIPYSSRGIHHWWPASSSHDWSHSHGRSPSLHEPVCAVCHLSVFLSGAAACLEQGRGLMLLSLQEFNWKGIVFDLISSLVSTQA